MENFDNIYDTYRVLIHRAIRKCRIYKQFEHYEQVGAIALWQASQKFDGPLEQFGGYAYTYIRFAILAELKKEHVYESRAMLTDDAFVFEAAQKITPVRSNDKLDALLERLAPADRQLLMMLYSEQYSYEEASAALGISVAALKKRRQRIMRKIRENAL